MSVFSRPKVSKLARKGDVRRLTDVLDDPDPRRRAEAAQALSEIGGPQAIDALIGVLDKTFTRDLAIPALGNIGPPAVEPLLHAFSQHDEDLVGAGAAQALGLTHDPRAAEPLIHALSDDVMSKVAAWALEAMGVAAVEPLVNALHDGDTQLAERAIPILQKLGGDQAVESLIGILVGDGSGATRVAAAQALGRIGGDRAEDALLVAVDHGDSAVRAAAAEALGWIGGDRAAGALLLAVRDSDVAIRAAAAAGFGRIGGDLAAETLLSLLDDSDAAVRSRAALWLGAVAENRVGEAALDAAALAAGFSRARPYKSAPLTSFDPQRAVEGLLRLLDDPRGDVRNQAVGALHRIGGRRAREAVLDALSDPDSAVRAHADLCLGTRPESVKNDVIEALLGALQSGDAAVRSDAGFKLAHIATTRRMTNGTHGPVSAEGVSNAIADQTRSESIRRAAADALTDLFAAAGFRPRSSTLAADLFPSEQPCSSCGRPVLQHKITSAVDVMLGVGLFGNVCFSCSKVFCNKCIQVGGPTPCPVCGAPTGPAGRQELASIGIYLDQTPTVGATADGSALHPFAVTTTPPVLDLRSAEEIADAERARQPLNETDEALAREMCQLINQADLLYGKDDVAYRATCALMRSIGERLGTDGGSDRMRLVAYRVQALGGRVRDCEQHWAGICGWQS